MAITKPQLKSLVKSQLPEFVREEYDTFVQFLQAYYEFLETTQVNLNTTRDLDNTLESFVSYFKNELAAKLPYSTIDERFLLQHIKDHYRAKGSENSFKLLFRILFNKEVTLDYPSKQMLRASDGKWNQDVSVFVRIIQGNPNDIVGKLVDVVTTTKIIRVLVDRRQYVEVEVDRAIRISDDVYEFVIENKEIIDGAIVLDRDFDFDYFGFKTLERSYLLKLNGIIVERPQHMLMRVSIGIHLNDIDEAIATYELMSKKFFTHATPTLFNAGTPKPQMSSCFLIGNKGDDIDGLFDTIKDVAKISLEKNF